MISHVIYYSASNVKEGLAIWKALKDAGVSESSIKHTPPGVMQVQASNTVARLASPPVSDAPLVEAKDWLPPKGASLYALSVHWEKMAGSNFRASAQMQAKFGLPNPATNRAGAITKMCHLLASGEVIQLKYPTRYLFASEVSCESGGVSDRDMAQGETPTIDPDANC